jgi:hypothetical protein
MVFSNVGASPTERGRERSLVRQFGDACHAFDPGGAGSLAW